MTSSCGEIEIYKRRDMITQEFNEQEQQRRDALGKLRELGIEPYPAPLYPVNATTREIKEGYDAEKGNFSDVCIAEIGRAHV